MRKKDIRGMTLVEVVVVLLIASISMTITGGILINSLGYFDTSTKYSLDKECLDGISEYIGDEIKYATDVLVSPNKPSDKDWHVLYVNKDILYRDDKEVFSEDYYSKRKLKINLRGFTVGEHRLDMKLKLVDKKDEEVYQTKNTFELVNFNMNDTKTEKDIFSNISTYTTLDINNKLWYIKDSSSTIVDDTDKPSSTPVTGGNVVGDQIKCINTKNYRGEFVSSKYQYKKGDIVYYNGYYWQICGGDSYDNGGYPGTPTGDRRRWKKLDDQFDYESYYELGDIVLYKGVKYIYINNEPFIDGKEFYTQDIPFHELGQESGDQYNRALWHMYFKVYEEGDEKLYKSHDCSSLWINNIETVTSKLDKFVKDGNFTNIEEIDEYSPIRKYNVGDYVKIKQSGDKDFYMYYLKVFDGIGEPGSSAASGWQILDRTYHSNSAYVKGDVVYFGKDNIEYIKAKRNVDVEANINEDIYTNHIYWEKN